MEKDFMMTCYCYCRVSSALQTLENQHFEIEQYAAVHNVKIDKWVEETISSRKALRERQLGKILKKIKKNDILITTELSRIGRNLLEVMTILQYCLEKGCQIWTLKEHYRLGSDIQSKILAFAFGLVGEMERQLISDRTKEALKRVKAQGKHIGRPLGKTSKKLQCKHNLIRQMLLSDFSKAEIARKLGCSWSTLNRYIKNCMQ